MAVLSNAARIQCWERWMRENLANVSINRNELRAAIDAADTWADSNAASYNSALPQPARGSLTAAQKALILMIVIARRHADGA